MVIADRIETAQNIFADKIKLGYNLLPQFLRNKVQVMTDTSTEMSLDNGSSISVSTSAR